MAYSMAGTIHVHSNLLVQLGFKAARRDLVKLLEIGIYLVSI
jgi:hypothetical protein